MLANLGAVVLFIVAWLARGNPEVMPGATVLALEGIGVGLLTVGGWLGGVLVSRNQISVDHRYAQAGTWKEEKLQSESGQPVVVARPDELKVNQMKLLRVDGRRLVLARTEEGYVAFDDRCTHRGGSLAGGVMMGGVVQCPWHGSQFDCKRGTVRAGPAGEPIGIYPVSEREGRILLTLGKQ
jgi:nitrite reductase/ring-hydroxylating ferredoxin subunit